MDWADEGFATNAHAPLRAMAAKKGWQILDWA
jgi:phosphoserine phosphatase